MRCEISQPSLKCMVLCCYGKMEIAVWFLRGRMEKKDAVIHRGLFKYHALIEPVNFKMYLSHDL